MRRGGLTHDRTYAELTARLRQAAALLLDCRQRLTRAVTEPFPNPCFVLDSVHDEPECASTKRGAVTTSLPDP